LSNFINQFKRTRQGGFFEKIFTCSLTYESADENATDERLLMMVELVYFRSLDFTFSAG
jgi:hypothetical protein